MFEILSQFSRGLMRKVGPKAAETLTARLPALEQGWRLWARTGSPSFSLPAGSTEVDDSGLRVEPSCPLWPGGTRHLLSGFRKMPAPFHPVAHPSSRPGVTAHLHFYRGYSLGKTVPSSPPSRKPCWVSGLPQFRGARIVHVWSFFVTCLLPPSTRVDWHSVVFSSLPSIVGAQEIWILKKNFLEIYFSKHC